jgi:hypothetical protein
MRKYKSRTDMFKLDNAITWYLKDHENDKEKQRKIISRNNGDLFFIFKPTEEQEIGRAHV